MKTTIIQEGNELRGFQFKIYPTKDQEQLFLIWQEDQRTLWNMLVAFSESAYQAKRQFAIRYNLAGPTPIRPIYDGLTPDESKSAKELYHTKCIEWSKKANEATTSPEVMKDIKGFKTVKDIAGYRKMPELLEHFRCKYDYQLCAQMLKWKYCDPYLFSEEEIEAFKTRKKLGSSALQSLVKRLFSKGVKQYRKKTDTMSLKTRSGSCFKLGNYGKRRSNDNFYNCAVLFNGEKIRGRLPGRKPEGRILEGVTIKKLADGWYASITIEVPKRVLPEPILGSIVGIDVGLDNLAAISEARVNKNPDAKIFKNFGPVIKNHETPKIIANHRGSKLKEEIAKRQQANRPVGRLHLQMKRHNMHVIYNDIIKTLADIEQINVEALTSNIGQRGSSKVSSMKLIQSILKQRFGNRVREVPPQYTSQECSQCGFRSKKTWSYEHGKIGNCPDCNHQEDRDVNAARNIAAKPPEQFTV